MIMKKAKVLLVVLAVFSMVAGCSNHTQKVIPRTTGPARARVASFFPSVPTSQTVSETPGPELAPPPLRSKAEPDQVFYPLSPSP